MPMIEIPDVCEFETKPDQIQFNTQTNGDSVAIRAIHLNSAQAATLAHLINDPNHTLSIEIKEKVDGS